MGFGFAARLEEAKSNENVRAAFGGLKVRIWSYEHGAWWNPDGAGYTSDATEAGQYEFEDAFSRTRHCGPEKGIQYETLDYCWSMDKKDQRLAVLHELLAPLLAIGKELITQDNLATAEPIFVVEQRQRIYGEMTGFEPTQVWIDDEGHEADEEESKKLYHEATKREVDGWDLVGFTDIWIRVQPFFTRKAADAYLKANAHNMKAPRVYVDSAYRNKEWQAVRAICKALAKEDDGE